MLPAANPIGVAVKPPQPATGHTASRTEQHQPQTARTSAGESGAANVKADTAHAVKAAEQAVVAPRLRDQETVENTPERDTHAGPPPSFDESPLERQARKAFDPPETDEVRDKPTTLKSETDTAGAEIAVSKRPADPPPTPTERAEVSFAETQAMSEPKEPTQVDSLK